MSCKILHYLPKKSFITNTVKNALYFVNHVLQNKSLITIVLYVSRKKSTVQYFIHVLYIKTLCNRLIVLNLSLCITEDVQNIINCVNATHAVCSSYYISVCSSYYISVYCSYYISVYCSYNIPVYCSYYFPVYCSYYIPVYCSYYIPVYCRYYIPVYCSYYFPVYCRYYIPVYCSYYIPVYCSYYNPVFYLMVKSL